MGTVIRDIGGKCCDQASVESAMVDEKQGAVLQDGRGIEEDEEANVSIADMYCSTPC